MARKSVTLEAQDRLGCVVVCSDANWAWQSSFVLMRSIDHDAHGLLDHHLYLSGDVDPCILSILPREITLHQMAALPEGYSVASKGHIPSASLMRLAALDELGKIYQRVIYLDGDVFQAWGSLSDLLDVNLKGNVIAAVRDKAQWGWKIGWLDRYLNELSQRCGVERLDYFNSGVLVVDGPAYVSADVSSRVFSFIDDNNDFLKYVDQCALNAVLSGKWCELSPGWNWQMSPKLYGLASGRRPRALHFTGRNKPWMDSLRLMPSEAFDAMHAFLLHHGLVHLLPKEVPSNFDIGSMERKRSSFMDEWARDTSLTREAIKNYLNRQDFADFSAGLVSFC